MKKINTPYHWHRIVSDIIGVKIQSVSVRFYRMRKSGKYISDREIAIAILKKELKKL